MYPTYFNPCISLVCAIIQNAALCAWSQGTNMPPAWIRFVVQPDVDQLNLDCNWRCFCDLKKKKGAKIFPQNNENQGATVLKMAN